MNDKTQALADQLELIRRFVEPLAEQSGYGYYRPENPHDFSPDPESCTEEEIAAHKAACDAYDRGEYKHERVGGWSDDGNGAGSSAPWGIGSYTARDRDAEAILASLPHLTRVLEDSSRLEERLAAVTKAADALAEQLKAVQTHMAVGCAARTGYKSAHSRLAITTDGVLTRYNEVKTGNYRDEMRNGASRVTHENQ